jgi:hypothetical protein
LRKVYSMNRGALLSASVSLVLVVASGCSKEMDRRRQVRTVADMQTIAAKLEALRGADPTTLSDKVGVEHIVSSVAGGKDAWGGRIVFLSRPGASQYDYVLVSPGSDGKLDLEDRGEYFSVPEAFIHDAAWRDIVFRNGRMITHAGK